MSQPLAGDLLELERVSSFQSDSTVKQDDSVPKQTFLVGEDRVAWEDTPTARVRDFDSELTVRLAWMRTVWSPENELVSVDFFGHSPEIPDRNWLGQFRSFTRRVGAAVRGGGCVGLEKWLYPVLVDR